MPEHRHVSPVAPLPPHRSPQPLQSSSSPGHMHIESTHNACARGHHERASHITALDPLSTVLGLSLLSVISESVCGRGDLPPCRCSPHNSCTAHPLISALHTLLSTHARLCPCVSFMYGRADCQLAGPYHPFIRHILCGRHKSPFRQRRGRLSRRSQRKGMGGTSKPSNSPRDGPRPMISRASYENPVLRSQGRRSTASGVS